MRAASDRMTGPSSAERRLHRRPHVQHDPVPVQPGQLAVGRPGRAQAVQAGVQDALELRQAGDPPGVVPHDGELAHVGQGDEPLVVGHLAAPDAEQVHVRGRGQPGELEPGEPPHAQSFGHQRVPAALGPVLHGLPVRPAPEGEPVRPAAPVAVRPAHGDRDPVDGRRDEAELAADPVRAGVGGAAAVLLGRLGGDVQVDEHGPAGRDRLDQLGQVGRGRALRAGGHRRDDQVLVPVVGVLRGHQRAAAPLGDLDVPQRPDPVVAPRHHLEHDRVVPLGEDAEDRLARGDHGVDLGRPGRGVRREPVQLGAHLLLAPGPLGGDQRGVEAAVADLPGQVADAGVPQLGGRDQLVERPPVVVPAVTGQRSGVVAAATAAARTRPARTRPPGGGRGRSGTAPGPGRATAPGRRRRSGPGSGAA